MKNRKGVRTDSSSRDKAVSKARKSTEESKVPFQKSIPFYVNKKAKDDKVQVVQKSSTKQEKGDKRDHLPLEAIYDMSMNQELKQYAMSQLQSKGNKTMTKSRKKSVLKESVDTTSNSEEPSEKSGKSQLRKKKTGAEPQKIRVRVERGLNKSVIRNVSSEAKKKSKEVLNTSVNLSKLQSMPGRSRTSLPKRQKKKSEVEKSKDPAKRGRKPNLRQQVEAQMGISPVSSVEITSVLIREDSSEKPIGNQEESRDKKTFTSGSELDLNKLNLKNPRPQKGEQASTLEMCYLKRPQESRESLIAELLSCCGQAGCDRTNGVSKVRQMSPKSKDRVIGLMRYARAYAMVFECTENEVLEMMEKSDFDFYKLKVNMLRDLIKERPELILQQSASQS